MSGFWDPMDHYKAKSKMKELDSLITQYNEIYKNASEEIGAIYKAKIYAVSIIEEAEVYINSLANTPKEYNSFDFSKYINNYNYRNTYEEINGKKKKKDTVNNVVIATFGIAAMLGGPIAWGAGLVVAGVAGNNKKKNNEKTIEKIDNEINKIRKEIANLISKDNEFMLEKDYIYKYATFIKNKLSEIKKTDIKNYTQFSEDQKKYLGAMVADVEQLAKRLDGSV